MKRLTLIRHGESLANAGDRSSDPDLIPLTQLGRQQAEIAAASIDVRPDVLVHSHMLRSRQSIQPFLSRFLEVPVETWPVHEFVFLNFKHAAPLTKNERKPLVDSYWDRCNPAEHNPDAESFEMLWQRIISFHEQVLMHPARKLVVVSHGFFMSAFRWAVTRDFPPCTPDLMSAVRAESLQNPIANSAVVEIELSGRPKGT